LFFPLSIKVKDLFLIVYILIIDLFLGLVGGMFINVM